MLCFLFPQILRAKKGGGFIILQAKAGFTPPLMEFREVYGMAFAQKRNDRTMSSGDVTRQVGQLQLDAAVVTLNLVWT